METGQSQFHPLPPQRIDCKWWKRGYCYRGNTCYFRHDEAMAGVDQTLTRSAGSSRIAEPQLAETNGNSRDPTPSAEQCGVCLEVPTVYGLLIHCNHVFCLECIRSWRSSSNKKRDDDDDDDIQPKDITKACPMCRTQSDFIIPSSVFPTPPPRVPGDMTSNGPPKNPHKERIVDAYLARLKQIPCRYFEKGVSRWYQKKFGASSTSAAKADPAFKPICFFANECHYAHTHPVTSEPYIFSTDEIKLMKQKRGKRRMHDTSSITSHSSHHDPIEDSDFDENYDTDFAYGDFADLDMDSDDENGFACDFFDDDFTQGFLNEAMTIGLFTAYEYNYWDSDDDSAI